MASWVSGGFLASTFNLYLFSVPFTAVTMTFTVLLPPEMETAHNSLLKREPGETRTLASLSLRVGATYNVLSSHGTETR